MVVSGRATGVVVGTGSQTELGRINQLLAGVSALETPLLRQIKKFGYAITAVDRRRERPDLRLRQVGARSMAFVELFQAITGIAVSVIPEGLPAIITITLAIGVQRMAQRNAIVRRLPAVETLGSVSRICSDKTGTLTLMEMMVVSAITAEARVRGQRQRLRARGRGQAGRRAGGRGPRARAAGPRLPALQRRGAVPAGRRLDGGGRPDRGGPLPVRDQARDGPAGRADRLSANRRHPVRVRAPLHGDAAPGRERRGDAAGEGRAGGHPRALRSAGDPGRSAGADRSRSFRAGVGPARRPGRARAGAGVAEEPRRQGRRPRPGRSAEEPGPARPDRPARSRRARRRSRRCGSATAAASASR